ncbi:MAG: caspase family protein [Rubripirellula sp.]|nr:caspase family protein [Rubripirellula sp.]
MFDPNGMSFRVPFRQSLFSLAIYGSLGFAAIGGTLGSATNGWGQTRLPDEGVLPGTQNSATTLPGEAELPGTDRSGRARVAGAEMPGEDQIPGMAAAPDKVNPSPPILRFSFDGHTARIRTLDLSEDGRTLVSAGSDKDVHIWERTDANDTGWLHRRTIRWPVSRGPRGTVYSAKLRDGWVAFGGYGAFGSAGEIRVVEIASGEPLQTLVTEDEIGVNILSLTWSPSEAPRLASINMQGRVMDWQPDPVTQIWRGRMWVDADRDTYGNEVAAELQASKCREFAAVSFVGEHHLVYPKLDLGSEPGKRVWHLEKIDLRTEARQTLKQFGHRVQVRCLAATKDGRVMASVERGGESGGNVGVWAFSEDGTVASFQEFTPSKPPMFADLDERGERIVVGTEIAENGQSVVEVWDVSVNPAVPLGQRPLADNVYSVALDDRNQQVIASQGTSLEVHAFDESNKLTDQQPQVMQAPVASVLKVAFEKGDGYKIGFGWSRDAEGAKRLEGVFDLAESKLMGRGPIDVNEFWPAQRSATRWGPAGPFEGDRFVLFEGNQPHGTLPLDPVRHGAPTSAGTVPIPSQGNEDPGAVPATGAVLIGTSGQGNIYIYRADESDPPELMRQFRGHADQVNSVSCSSDGKYMVSGSADSTIAVWNLQDVFDASEMMNRWGVEFEVEGDRVIAAKVDQAGPLYFRGVREGDQLALIQWVLSDESRGDETNAKQIQRQLLELPFDTQVYFEFRRLSRPGPKFQSFPAWRPLATLFVDQNREWAFWTPAGYYDASFNGHQNFGWQINPVNSDRPVQYFLAAQFRKQLERPDIMRGLMQAGSLQAAVETTLTQIGPPPAEGAIVNQIETRPVIRLLSPDPSNRVDGDRLTVRAEITVPIGASLINPKAFVSGVPAVGRHVIPNAAEADDSRTTTFQWEFRLPSDPALQLEILAATESESIGRLLIDLEHQPSQRPRPKPRLHVLAIGVSEYGDPQIQSLDFAAKAAGTITDLFRDKSAAIYQTSADALTDTDAIRPLWRGFAQGAAEELAESVSPDDLVIMYLCGHGLRDRRTNQWYFVTADARYSDLMNDRYDDCIAFSDLAALSSLPCRKLAILDSCHSGAVQSLMRRDDLKSALRFLQEDLVLTLTASEGDQEAAEQRETRLGRFTTALVDALNGKAAEIKHDGQVSLDEVIQYVTERVTAESEAEGVPQHPTASPHYLLRTLQLPLTSR